MSAGDQQKALDSALVRNFANGARGANRRTLTEAEVDTLGPSCFALACELATRFLDDYIVGDKYFKVRQPGQNLNRARVQFRLCEAIEARERSILEILAKL